jgi:periplasmic protein TonB
MKTTPYIYVLLLLAQMAFAQAETEDSIIMCLLPTIKKAAFPNGEKALLQYLADNIVYPLSAKQNCIEGKILAEFIVAEDGCIENIKIKRGLSEDINAEVLRVLSEMPVWEPGCMMDELERQNFTLPIIFSL